MVALIGVVPSKATFCFCCVLVFLQESQQISQPSGIQRRRRRRCICRRRCIRCRRRFIELSVLLLKESNQLQRSVGGRRFCRNRRVDRSVRI